MIKFNMYNVVDDSGYKARVYYWPSTGSNTQGAITVSARDYGQQLIGLIGYTGVSFRNDSDSMTDYFETDTLYIMPESPLYKGAQSAMLRNNAAYNKRMDRARAKRHSAV